MRRLARRLFPFCAGLSLLVFVAAGLLWVRTEALGYTDTLVWGGAGEYRAIEFSADDAEHKILRDPGRAPTALRLDRRRRGWLPPPRPAQGTAALPAGAVTWYIPSPSSLADGRLVTGNAMRPNSRRTFVATSYGGPRTLGFEYARFDGWYGPGTSLASYRFSYFLVLIPAAVVPTAWVARFALRRWRYGRFGPGQCRGCGYDLRASPGRCPECGTVVGAFHPR